MADASSVSSGLATLGAGGWAVNPGRKYVTALTGDKARSRALTIIPFGTSITQNNALFASGLWQFGSGYAESSIYQAGPRFQIVRNAGIGGNTSAQMLARLATDVLAYSPDVVLMEGLTNDLTTGMSNAAIAAMMSNFESMTRQMLQAGILPVIVTPPPKNAAATESRKAQWFCYALAQAYGVPLIDVYKVLVDPTTGNYLASYSGDGIHPNPAGITAMSAIVSAALNNLSNAFCGPYMAAYSESSFGQFSNIIANGNFARVTSSPTPDTWTVNATNATQTIPSITPAAGAPYNGNTFNYNKTVSGGVYALFGAAPTSGYVAGDVLQFSGRINVSGLTPASASGFTLGLDMVGSSGNFRPFTACPFNGDFVFCETMTVPVGTTSMTPTLFVQDVALYKVNNLTLFNVTQANAIWQPQQT